MPMGCVVYLICYAILQRKYAHSGVVIYTYRRGVCVARFDEQGNAKASKSETGDRYRFSRFFILNGINAESGESIGKTNC